jgi:dynactin complex subunit
MGYISAELLQKLNALFITCYCQLKVISYITILLSLNCKALHYFCITFALLIINLVFDAAHYTAGGDVVWHND